MTLSSTIKKDSALTILVMNTLAFTACFACWMLYGVLIKFLTTNGLHDWNDRQAGILIAAPILTGSLARLPLGVLTDRHGGRIMFILLMFVSACGLALVSYADSFAGFFIAGLCFGLSGASFAVGIAYTSSWFKASRQGMALGVFGMGNTGAALTLYYAPRLLDWLTTNGQHLNNWRHLPLLYAAMLIFVTVIFALMTTTRTPHQQTAKTLRQRLEPLRRVQVWRFCCYYFFVFGGFVGLCGWLSSYYVDHYHVSLRTAGTLAATFVFPCGIVRALGGWFSDRIGARAIMYAVLSSSTALCILLLSNPTLTTFTVTVFALSIMMGLGMAAVYKHIPVYFPNEVGVVGGLVGVVGGLGGFVMPILFGALLTFTGMWTTCWMILMGTSLTCLLWMHASIRYLNTGLQRS